MKPRCKKILNYVKLYLLIGVGWSLGRILTTMLDPLTRWNSVWGFVEQALISIFAFPLRIFIILVEGFSGWNAWQYASLLISVTLSTLAFFYWKRKNNKQTKGGF